MSDELRVSPRVQSRGVIDFCIVVFIVSPVLLGIVFGVPAFVAFLFTDSSLVALLVIVAVFITFTLFTVSHLTLSSDGIRFHRVLGAPKFLPWSRVVSVKQASRWELILRGWFWPPFPAKEMTTSLSSVGHYKIQWDSGFCYFPPAYPSTFEQYVQQRIQNRAI
jgi:hypothetical protein